MRYSLVTPFSLPLPIENVLGEDVVRMINLIRKLLKTQL